MLFLQRAPQLIYTGCNSNMVHLQWMKTISCLLGHILLPAGFGLSGQKFLHLHTVFTGCPMRGSADSKLHVSREREREHKHGSRIVSWHHDIALAQDQQPDGQLPISSEQVGADHSAILPTLFSSLFPTSFALFSVSLLLQWPPTPSHISLRAQPRPSSGACESQMALTVATASVFVC